MEPIGIWDTNANRELLDFMVSQSSRKGIIQLYDVILERIDGYVQDFDRELLELPDEIVAFEDDMARFRRMGNKTEEEEKALNELSDEEMLARYHATGVDIRQFTLAVQELYKYVGKELRN